ncbi:MAG TPA: hypothetical protein PL169_13870, partial [Leptospiraceae bacterium]|nr:hypothetical protein [Leptospiraceae bacterium]
ESGLDYLYFDNGMLFDISENDKARIAVLEKKSKKVPSKIRQQNSVLEKQSQEIVLLKETLKEKEEKIQSQGTMMVEKDREMNEQMKGKDILIEKHHHFAQELMAELAKRKIKFETKWPG